MINRVKDAYDILNSAISGTSTSNTNNSSYVNNNRQTDRVSDAKNILSQAEEDAKTTLAKKKQTDKHTSSLYSAGTMSSKDYEPLISEAKSQLAAKRKERAKLVSSVDRNSEYSGWATDELTALNSRSDSERKIDDEIAALVEKIDALETGKWSAKGKEKYSNLSENEDYYALSRSIDNNLGKSFGITLGDTFYGVGDDVYAYINNLNGRQKNAKKPTANGTNGSAGLYKYDYMTYDEKKNYNYIYQKEGKAAATEYLDYLSYALDSRRTLAYSNEVSEIANKNFGTAAITSILSEGTNLMSGIGLTDIALQKASRDITGNFKPINYNYIAMQPTTATTSIRGAVANKITDATGGKLELKGDDFLSRFLNGKSWGDAYQLVMSMADSLAVAYGLGPFGTIALGGSAGSQGVLDALERGATDNQALTMGVLNGTFEALFEYVSLEQLVNGKTTGNIIRDILQQGLFEGSEELSTTFFNTIADIIVMAGNSDYQRSIQDYMKNGLSLKEAESMAIEDIIIGMGWDFIGGALSGGIMRGTTSAIKNLFSSNQYDGNNTTNNKYGPGSNVNFAEGVVDVPNIRQLKGTQYEQQSQYDVPPTYQYTDYQEDTYDTQRVEPQEYTADAEDINVPTNDSFDTTSEINTKKDVTSRNTATPKNTSKDTNVDSKTNANNNAVTLEEASKKYGAQAQAFIHTFQAGQDVAKYDAAYNEVFNYGMAQTVPLDVVKKLSSLSALTEKQIELAYKTGEAAAMTRAERMDARNKATAKNNGEVWQKGSILFDNEYKGKGTVKGIAVKADDLYQALNDTQKIGYRILSKFAEASGVNIVLYNSEAGPDGRFYASQGEYSRSEPGTIYIDINAGLSSIHDVSDLSKYTMVFTFSHDFCHFIERWNPVGYNELRKTVFAEMRKNGNDPDLLVRAKMDGGLSYEAASREVVAESLSELLPQSSFVETLYKEHKSIFDKLLEKLKQFVADIKAYFEKVNHNVYNRDAEAIMKNIDGAMKYSENIIKLFNNVAKEAVENYQKSFENNAQQEEIDTVETSETVNDTVKETKPEVIKPAAHEMSSQESAARNLAEQYGYTIRKNPTPELIGRPDIEQYGVYDSNGDGIVFTVENANSWKIVEDFITKNEAKAEQAKPEPKTTSSEFGFTITDNTEYNSIEIKFDERPSVAVRDVLKANKFRWNGKKGVWYGKATHEEITEALNKVYEAEKESTVSSNEKTLGEELTEILNNSEGEERQELIDAIIENNKGPEHMYPTEIPAKADELKEINNNGENEDNQRTVLQSEPDGNGASRLLDELQTEDVQGTGRQREPVATDKERGGQNQSDSDRQSSSTRSSGSERTGEIGDIRRDVGLSQEETQAKLEKLHETATEQIEQQSTEKPKGSNFVIDESLNLPSGEKARFRANIDAIKLIKQLEDEGRYATPAEQEILSKYVGWGGLSNAFGEMKWNSTARKTEMVAKSGWEKEFAEFRQLIEDGYITEDEYNGMSASTKNAHYTSVEVIKAMYDGLAQLGFNGGRMLEPSSGVGNFVGGMPANMSRTVKSWTMVELDRITSLIAKYLYPNADVRNQGFETANIPDNYMDVAIGNVPFGDYGVVDRNYPKRITKSIHNYFFAKSLDKVRTGGIVMFITSRYTMDSTDTAIRQYIVDRADLLGAIRLPETAFKGNARTDVVTDILILKKRASGTEYAGETFLEAPYTDIGDRWYKVNINEYFDNHPEMVLGTAELARGMHGPDSLTYKPISDKGTLGDQIREAFKNITGKMDYKVQATPEKTNFAAEREGKKPKKGSLEVGKDGKVYRNDNGNKVEVSSDKDTAERVSGLLGIRDAYRNLVNYQQQGLDDKIIKKARIELNNAYDDFVKKYGYINDPKNAKAIEQDPKYKTNAAKKKITRFAMLHETNIAQRVEIIIEHFRNAVADELGGQAKAMVITGSRAEAVKYHQAFEAYINKNNIKDVHSLVAFSGKVSGNQLGYGDDISVTESSINGFSEEKTPSYFDTNDYQVLIVANKYQTGFDQPKLCAMYILKKLKGVNAVQTLSRLNRIFPPYDKKTFILDFVNTYEDIEKSFEPYYTTTLLTNTVTKELIYELEQRLDEFSIIDQDDLDDFNNLLYGEKNSEQKVKLNAYLAKSKKAFDAFDTKEQKEAYLTVRRFIRFYEFLILATSFEDVNLHKKYNYASYLASYLSVRGGGNGFNLEDKIEATNFKQNKGKTVIKPDIKSSPEIKISTADTLNLTEDEEKKLSEIIKEVNSRTGKSFDSDVATKAALTIKDILVKSDGLKVSAKNNNYDDFKFAYYDNIDEALMEGWSQNQEFFTMLLNNEEIKKDVLSIFMSDVYKTLRTNNTYILKPMPQLKVAEDVTPYGNGK